MIPGAARGIYAHRIGCGQSSTAAERGIKTGSSASGMHVHRGRSGSRASPRNESVKTRSRRMRCSRSSLGKSFDVRCRASKQRFRPIGVAGKVSGLPDTWRRANGAKPERAGSAKSILSGHIRNLGFHGATGDVFE
jgi:hypothetical protein